MPRAESSRGGARNIGPTSRSENRACVDSNPEAYLFRVHIKDVTDPIVERYLCVPCDFSFQRFASVLQVAFGWGTQDGMSRFSSAEKHYWTFDLIANRPLRNPRSRRLKAQKLRVLKTSEDIGDEAGMDEVSGRPPQDLRHAQKWSLRKILEPEIEGDTSDLKFVFDYNGHDEWQHVIEILGIAPSNMRTVYDIDDKTQVFCYGGQGSRIAENCSKVVRREGPISWRRIKEAFDANVPDNPESAALRQWCAYDCENYSSGLLLSGLPALRFDPYNFRHILVNHHLSRIRKRDVR